MSNTKLFTSGWADYELIDAGGGKKLERWGDIVTIRPEVQAYFRSGLDFKEWTERAHWEFVSKGGQTGMWKAGKQSAADNWTIAYEQLKFQLRLTKFKHLGLFPEQRCNWDFISELLKSEDRFLNLFAYTGAASCASRLSGAETYHVDSVKQLLAWAHENMEASQLRDIKWVHEDALRFAQREVKRGKTYKGIIMDPPAWGTGVKNEKWKLEDKLDSLLSDAAKLVAPKGFLIINTYSPTVDLGFIRRLCTRHLSAFEVEIAELWMKTTTEKELYFGILVRAVRKY